MAFALSGSCLVLAERPVCVRDQFATVRRMVPK